MTFFTHRSYVRLASYITASLAIIIALAIINTNNMRSYKTQLEASYRQSLGELSGCLECVNTDLTKTLYSNSDKEIYNLSRDLFAQCQTAKNAISRLPVSQMELGNVYKFLSQASDYAQYIGNKVESNQPITKKEHQSLNTLLSYAQKFSDSANEMVRLSQSGARITDGAVKSNETISVKSLSADFSNGAKSFESFPTLLYDGPFSDGVLNKKSKLVSHSEVKTKDECKDIAASALGVDSNKVIYSTDSKGKLPCYSFKCGRYTIDVTKQGGYVKSILYSGAITADAITEQNAQNLAKRFLSETGYKNMEASYYSTADNICTINYVYVHNATYCYSDLIKCSIALDSGNVVGLDASTYLTNHIVRGNFRPRISQAQAMSKLSPYLTVNAMKRALIPKENGREVQCWEFACTSKDTGEDALVYINAKTGAEEDIMLLLYTDNGTLAK
ncbi:MAG: germination protein YpeB [Eubacterium sp.]|nr:germination protein YpeB [Eubacterium sp.]